MSTERRIENTLEEIGVKPDNQHTGGLNTNDTHERVDTSESRSSGSEPEVVMETVEREKVVPYHPKHGIIEDETYTQVLEDGSQRSITAKPRPQCPRCNFIVLDISEETLPSRCVWEDCNRWTCPACHGICESCGGRLCPRHTTGHATKDETYCFDCVGDIEEQVRHEREMERRQQEHSQRMDMREQERREKRQQEELDMQRQDKDFNQTLDARKYKLAAAETLLQAERQGHEIGKSRNKRQPDHFEGIQNTVDNIIQGTR
jgi:hypothetical protein